MRRIGIPPNWDTVPLGFLAIGSASSKGFRPIEKRADLVAGSLRPSVPRCPGRWELRSAV